MQGNVHEEQVQDLDIEANAKLYSRLVARWPRTNDIRIFVRGYGNSFSVPRTFVETSGDNTWRLVLRMLQAIVNEPGELLHGSTSELAGERVDMSATPAAGVYDFIPTELGFTWRKGPEGARKGRALAEGESHERSSISAVSTATGQTALRDRLLVRDGYCLLSGGSFDVCQAAHIVPKARLDIYRALGNGFEYNSAEVFEVWMGILVRTELHQSYDRYAWSLYFLDGNYYVHVFDPTANDSSLAQYHGKCIPSERFRIHRTVEERPSPALCNWHWQQCCMMHLRAFSAGMSVNAF